MKVILRNSNLVFQSAGAVTPTISTEYKSLSTYNGLPINETGNDYCLVTINGSGVIRYTTDGSTPTGSSPMYSAPFELKKSATIKAISIFDGNISEVATKQLDYVYFDGDISINTGGTIPVAKLAAEESTYRISTDANFSCNFQIYDAGTSTVKIAETGTKSLSGGVSLDATDVGVRLTSAGTSYFREEINIRYNGAGGSSTNVLTAHVKIERIG